jgi:hypothetical protein
LVGAIESEKLFHAASLLLTSSVYPEWEVTEDMRRAFLQCVQRLNQLSQPLRILCKFNMPLKHNDLKLTNLNLIIIQQLSEARETGCQ